MRAMPSRTSSTVPTSDTSAVARSADCDLAEQDVFELARTKNGIGRH